MYKPKTEWVRVERTHEPLIDMNLWNNIRDIATSRYRPRKKSDGSVSIFCGLLYCSECGFKMRSATQKKIRKNGEQYAYTNFLCGTYSRSGKAACSSHSIGEIKLHDNVLEQIRNHARIAESNEKNIVEDISEKLYGELLYEHRKNLIELEKCQDDMNMLNKIVKQSYEDRLKGILSVLQFKVLMEYYEPERKDNQEKIYDLENRIRSFQPNESNPSKWVSLIKGHVQLEKLDTQVLLSLVEQIVVSEARTDADKTTRKVKIIYKYVGDISWIV